MKVYVINLDKDAERLDFMRAQFRSLNLDFERVSAVLLNGDQRSKLSPQPQTVLSNAEVGCFLSHIKVWTLIVQSGDPYACVFEDDVAISADASELLSSTHWIPKHAGLIKLETAFTLMELGKKRCPVVPPYEAVVTQSNYAGSAGYIISRQTCLKLLQDSKYIGEAVDLFLFSARLSVLSYQIVPAPCVQLLNLDKASFDVEGPVFSSHIAGTYSLDQRAKRSISVRIRRRIVREARKWLYVMSLETVPFAFEGWGDRRRGKSD